MALELKDEIPQSVKGILEIMITRFQERTGQNLNSSVKSAHDLETAINAHCAVQKDEQDMRNAKDMALQMIHCFQVLGGIAAQGASIMFGPASLCFNALSLLLDIPEKVHGFHEEVNAIFVDVGRAIGQFRIYERMDERTLIDNTLRTSIYEVMVCFVDLCSTCIKINNEGTRKSLKRIAKRIFLDDKSVTEELEKFRQLTQVKQDIESTLTLEAAITSNQYLVSIQETTFETNTTTRAIKTDVSSLLENERKRSLDEIWKTNRTNIQTKLGVKPEQIKAATEVRDHDSQNTIKDGGKWLNEVHEYTQWIDKSSTAEPLLLITGGPGTGKTYVVSAILQDINSGNSSASDEKCLVAYYSFSATGKSNNRQRPETALKNICAQLANYDSAYAKKVAQKCMDPGKDEKFFRQATCRELWATLALGSPEPKSKHYIVLHSVDLLSSEELERLLEAVQQQDSVSYSEGEKASRVRILASGEPNAFKEANLNLRAVPTVDVSQYNEPDIIAFIEAELKREDLLQGRGDKEETLRTSIQERLLRRSKKSYLAVQQDLKVIKDIINSLGTEDDLFRALQEPKTDPGALGRSDLTTLEAVLKPKEIDEVNELLIWALAPPVYFDVEQLSAALFLRFNNIPVQPLAQRVATRYSKIFTFIFGDKYLDLQENVKECIVATRKEPRESHKDHKITATITISNCSTEEIQRFLWDLNHHNFVHGFTFQPQSSLLESSRRRIQLYMTDAHFEIVKRAFDFFHQQSVDERAKPLGGYLMEHITFHLEALYEADDLDQLHSAEKQYIGSNIYEMFNEGELIERNWEYCRSVRWYESDKDMSIFWRWLDDTKSMALLGPWDRKWLRKQKTKKNPNRSLLVPIMTTVAEHWLRKTDWDPLVAFRWICGFLQLGVVNSESGETDIPVEMINQQDENDGDGISISSNDSGGEMIEKAARWGREVLDVKDVDHIWCIRLGDTYYQMNQVTAALQQYEQAASILQAHEPIDKNQLRNVFQSLAMCSGDEKAALGYLQQAHDLDPQNVEIMYNILRKCDSSTEDVAELIIQESVTSTQSGTDSKVLRAILDMALNNQDEGEIISLFHLILSFTSRCSEWWFVYRREMEALIEDASDYKRAILLHAQGIAMYYRGEEPEDRSTQAAALWSESVAIIRNLNSGREVWDYPFYSIQQSALARVGITLFEKAVRLGPEDYPSTANLYESLDLSAIGSSSIKFLLAAGYSFHGQQDRARDLLRDEMVTAFDILVDDDTGNDWKGYHALRNISKSLGDWETCLQASQQLPELRFDEDVLKALLASENEILDNHSMEMLDIYHTFCSQEKKDPRQSLDAMVEEARKRAQEPNEKPAREDSEHTTDTPVSESVGPSYQKIFALLNLVKIMSSSRFWCDSCSREWGYEASFHECKYCYDTNLCHPCWEKLQSSETPNIFVCSKTHKWLDQGTWDIQLYIQACKRLVQVKSDDGSTCLIHVKKWLGNLCDEWGLDKQRWGFE